MPARAVMLLSLVRPFSDGLTRLLKRCGLWHPWALSWLLCMCWSLDIQWWFKYSSHQWIFKLACEDFQNLNTMYVLKGISSNVCMAIANARIYQSLSSRFDLDYLQKRCGLWRPTNVQLMWPKRCLSRVPLQTSKHQFVFRCHCTSASPGRIWAP